MKEKIDKVYSIIKKDGFFGFMKKSLKFIKSEFEHFFNVKNRLKFIKNKKDYEDYIQKLFLNENYERIIIWRSRFGWNVPLYQRPQHISSNLSKQKCLIFYEITTMTDDVLVIKKEKENLYLVNFKNKKFAKMLLKGINNSNKPKYLHFYSTDWTLTIKTIKNYINNGYKIIYEYIDELSPLLSGTKKLPKNILDKYQYVLKDVDNVFVVTTADLLYEDILIKRGNRNLVFSTNGVDYNFFQSFDINFKFEKDFKKIIKTKKPLIGYYGALASWFDYKLIKKINDIDKYNIVLFGVKYDDSYDKAQIENCKNVHFLGSKDYKVLKNYAKKIDVLIIPFLINNITKATSPVKIFEYMALKKPIVTTDMHECKKYQSVLIGKSHDDFIECLKLAIKNKNDEKYLKLLDKEARENDWFEKAKVIVEMLKSDENG